MTASRTSPLAPAQVAALDADLRQLAADLGVMLSGSAARPATRSPAAKLRYPAPLLQNEESAGEVVGGVATRAQLALQHIRRDLAVSDHEREIARLAGVTPEQLAAERNPAAARAAAALEAFIGAADGAAGEELTTATEREIARVTGVSLQEYLATRTAREER